MFSIKLQNYDIDYYHEITIGYANHFGISKIPFMKEREYYANYKTTYNKINSSDIILKDKIKKNLNSRYRYLNHNNIELFEYIYKISFGDDQRKIWCPYCSSMMYKEMIELEHHKPKADYPEYYIFPLNLIPICGNCNKSNKFKFCNFHPYFEKVEKIFTIKYKKKENTIELTYIVNDNPSGQQFNIWANLKNTIIRRIEDRIIEYSRYINDAELLDSFINTLEFEYVENINLFGENNYINQFDALFIELYKEFDLLNMKIVAIFK